MRARRVSAVSPALPGGRGGFRRRLAWTLALGMLLAAVPARAELRFSDRPEVFLNDQELVVQAVLLGAIPPAFHEHLHSGVTTHIRFYIELWQYSRFWINQRMQSRMVERQLTYNVVSKEYKVAATAGEQREPYVTKDLREAQRVASEIRGLKVGRSATLDPGELYYVQVRADVSLSGVNTILTRMMGEAEETPWIRSTLLTVTRTQ
ncbi:MAG: DUF4390 domain-containing protein [Candidatus Rokubacteria bacterium]|nr:DUF4390 domain-containing protein [Candidatus Rokubacteria bacterium]MBI3028500.1 DUF4390 domain-containing protein [Candidatus Rokubacteria bacterium]